jgi:hypothetical protein
MDMSKFRKYNNRLSIKGLTIKHTENLEERIERAKRLLQEVDRKNRKEE